MNRLTLIDNYIDHCEDWQRKVLQELRDLIHETDPEITEEWKWDVPVFTHKTMICAVSSFKDHVKINFFKGASLNDTQKIFNNGLESKLHRSIDFFENDSLNKAAIKDLLHQAVILNTSHKK